MTREEAQIIIGNIPIYGDDCYTIPEYQEAKAKAIEALGQPEIIHCKNCEHNESSSKAGNANCNKFYGMTDQMGFCHYGERRADEQAVSE